MSIPVDVGDLARALDDFGVGYLLSTTDGRVKAVTVEPRVSHGVLRVTGPGRGSVANVAVNPTVTVLFPPLQQRGYTLLVDGTAACEGNDLVVMPTNAVLHRPASHGDGSDTESGTHSGCGHDCQHVS
ncbi:MAG: pyridoxamine 5'-phosphate oxidase [Nocardioides sp.]